MDWYVVTTRSQQIETEESLLAVALAYAVIETSKDGAHRTVVDEDNRAFYRLEADTKVDEDDARFPVIVHTDAVLVGENN